tara:strand:- start:1653 stop:2207 length:555 start_codon:yes stop_codon:yes gene_type:complete
MKENIFSTPIYHDKVDLNKIIINNQKFEKTFDCEVITSHNFKNTIEEKSFIYLKKKIKNLLEKDIDINFDIILTSIWENKYIDNDYQEKHIHPDSHFSFIIYKEIDVSKTVFYSPHSKLLETYFYKFPYFFKTMSPSFKPNFTKGDMVLFPSFLEHAVLKHSGSTTISGNIILKNYSASTKSQD